MDTSDVAVYSYTTDDGHKIAFSLGVSGDRGTLRKVNVTIVVDGVERMHTTGHTCLPPGMDLGEWLIHGILQCLGKHMDEYNRFNLIHNLLVSANADELVSFQIDDRHIDELTDEQAEWWNEDEARSIGRHVINQIKPAVLKILESHPELRGVAEGEEQK